MSGICSALPEALVTDEVLARADKNFVGENCSAQVEDPLHACRGNDLHGSHKFALTGNDKTAQRVCAERTSKIR